MKQVFDARFGKQGGSRYRDPQTGRIVPGPKVLRLKCALCGKNKPLAEMRESRRFSPPLIVCQNCE